MDNAGPYNISGKLGAGGMGVVYRAEDTRLGRQVALKFLAPVFDGDNRAAARLEREARTASSLNHPNICTIYEIGQHEGRRYIAMELLEGSPLTEAIGGRPMEVSRVLDLGIQIADALDAAHAQGIIHRDIKPANIFVTRRGLAKVLDFGIARVENETGQGATQAAADASTLVSTQPGTVTGTIAYMSPEQALSQPVDARTDVFSLGLVLYEMATGRQVFNGPTPAAIYDAILNRESPSACAANPSVPPAFEEILGRALEKDPSLRYQTAADLRADLQRLKRNLETQRLTRTALGQVAPDVPARVTAAGQTAALPPAGTPSVPRWIIPAIGGIVVALAGVLVMSRLSRSDTPPPTTSTSAPLAASSPAPSPATSQTPVTSTPKQEDQSKKEVHASKPKGGAPAPVVRQAADTPAAVTRAAATRAAATRAAATRAAATPDPASLAASTAEPARDPTKDPA
ncbi:MAG TPA: serine/threonine-protein kinase, partial [Vicinamibacterales bacterium]